MGEGLAWVDVEGHEMLARISSRPEPGQQLSFLVAQLYPDVVLKELRGSGEGFSPGGLLHLYRTVRDEFERVMGGSEPRAAGGEVPPPSERKTQFFEDVARNPEALARYVRLLELLDGVNGYAGSVGEGGGEGRVWYLPWMVPGATGQELLLRQWPGDGSEDSLGDETLESVGGIQEIVFGFALRGLGRAEVRLLVGPDKTGCRILLERMEFASAVKKLVQKSLPSSLSDSVEILGVGPLPPGTVDIPGGLPAFNTALSGYRHLDKRV
jgi:hypothetical protein